jgi:excinuclease ABC subunit A
MDVIKTADYIIDIGPEGGRHGGNVVFQGKPEELAKLEGNHTARFLKSEL